LFWTLFIICSLKSLKNLWSWGTSVSIVSDYRMNDQFDPWHRQRIFLLASVARPALRLTQPPIQWAPGFLSLG
jgi:hypothetical protein